MRRNACARLGCLLLLSFPVAAATRAQIDVRSLPGLIKPASGTASGASAGPAGGANEGDAAGGLTEALSHGISSAVTSTGHPGGFLDNPAIRIGMPPKLARVEQGLRAVGMGPQIDSFVKSMNAAAEQAAPAAKSILLEALHTMTFSDARGIVAGDRTAGTEYFKRTSTGKIQEAFRPIVEQAMAKTGVTEQFTALMARAPALPFGKTPSVDINQYVLDKSTDGLFVVMGQEETKIRTDPAAQVTPLLRSVFGGR